MTNIRINMNAQDAVDNRIWKMLVRIKEQDLLSDWRSMGILNIGRVDRNDEKVLHHLQDKGVIEIQNVSFKVYPGVLYYAGITFAHEDIKCRLVQPAFDEMYMYYESLQESRDNTRIVGGAKLTYYPDDGIAEYKGEEYQFVGKGKALLSLLNSNKNTPYTIEDIKTKCNPEISNLNHKFRGAKDIMDTLALIRRKLKVNHGEYFPIIKQDNNWIWLEKNRS